MGRTMGHEIFYRILLTVTGSRVSGSCLGGGGGGDVGEDPTSLSVYTLEDSRRFNYVCILATWYWVAFPSSTHRNRRVDLGSTERGQLKIQLERSAFTKFIIVSAAAPGGSRGTLRRSRRRGGRGRGWCQRYHAKTEVGDPVLYSMLRLHCETLRFLVEPRQRSTVSINGRPHLLFPFYPPVGYGPCVDR